VGANLVGVAGSSAGPQLIADPLGSGMKSQVGAFLALLLFACVHPPATLEVAASTPSSTTSACLDTGISLVETFGLWENGGRYGSLRVVVTKGCSPEHCADRAYLQWLEAVQGSQGYERTTILASVPLEEIGDFVMVQTVSRAATESNPNRFELRVANTYTGDEGVVCVTPAGPGRYSAHEGACPAAA